ncbi:hypothetical protein OSB04_014949 [Centaurea solstitialis]|uniref:F-box domain-containing protein n=1 Tax=Centaurea solstitialis TaxID=347529 RepID=A0AA38SY19_9ASTR|nr:hypothetical protein OSB04_014949 [Centaurea solstitialis]
MSLKMSTQLPFDIQFLIIERLPIKSLLRFRSVCKPWKSFISSSGFIAGYTPHPQQHHLIIRYKDLHDEVKCVSVFDDDQTFALTVPPLVKGTRLLDSSHGLLCMIDSFIFTQTQMVVLWNPAIRRSIVVAVPNVVENQQFSSFVGFGVCPITKDPKLLKITYIRDPSNSKSISCIPFQVMVFTLSSGQWTTPSTNLPRKSIQFHNYHTVIGQLIYLVGNDWSALNDDGEGRTLIVSFDLTTHEFAEVDIPNSLHNSYLSLSRLRESLVLLHTDQDLIQDKEVFHVWVMDDGDSKTFTKLFTINPPNAYVWWTLGFKESGEPVIEWTHDETVGTSTLGVYEPGLGEIKDLGIRGNQDSFYGSSYTESLLLLDHEDGCIIRPPIWGPYRQKLYNRWVISFDSGCKGGYVRLIRQVQEQFMGRYMQKRIRETHEELRSPENPRGTEVAGKPTRNGGRRKTHEERRSSENPRETKVIGKHGGTRNGEEDGEEVGQGQTGEMGRNGKREEDVSSSLSLSLKMSTQIPFDIQLLIIERLPIKSLLRFRSVCKPWNSFISSFNLCVPPCSLATSYYNLRNLEVKNLSEVKCVSF